MCFLWQLLGWEIATDQGYHNCRVGETDIQDVCTVFPDHTNDYAAGVQVWVSCMIESCLWQLLGWETATDVGWSHWFFIKNFLVAEYKWEAISVSLLWTLKDILEYVFWQGAFVAVPFCVLHHLQGHDYQSHNFSLSQTEVLSIFCLNKYGCVYCTF